MMRVSRNLPACLAVGLFGIFYLALPAAAQSPFEGFIGSWTGAGTISLSDGSSERMQCHATYRAGALETEIQQNLRCDSPSYNIDLSADVVSQDGRVSGNWSETSRGVSGNLQGRATIGHLWAAVEAEGYSAKWMLIARNNRQLISIASEGAVQNVSISMARN